MRPESWVEEVFGSRGKVRLLRVLARDSGRRWTERELAGAAGISANAANLALRDLRDGGILTFEKAGRSHLVSLRADLTLSRTLSDFFRAERETLVELERAIAFAVPPHTAAYLFGSTHRGTAHKESDVDVLVACATPEATDEAIARITRAIGRILPIPLEIVGVDRSSLRRPGTRRLAIALARDGKPLTATLLEEFI
ncbi:MAG TPA: nucleotidyltransferase domain-containing protein [Candidatus Thermoplasmatota archaeon]|nr:nucleotidyltransferase domain-containing protein [Candidatus Thermoplasmatota archaeon]